MYGSFFSVTLHLTPFILNFDTRTLQNAIDKCNNPNDQTGSGITEACSFLTVANTTLADGCKILPTVDETIDGQLTKLPG